MIRSCSAWPRGRRTTPIDSKRRSRWALAREPRNVPALLARALARVGQSQWERALPDAEAAVAARPNELDALNLLLRVEMHLGLTRRAAATLARRDRAQERLKQMNEVG